MSYVGPRQPGEDVEPSCRDEFSGRQFAHGLAQLGEPFAHGLRCRRVVAEPSFREPKRDAVAELVEKLGRDARRSQTMLHAA